MYKISKGVFRFIFFGNSFFLFYGIARVAQYAKMFFIKSPNFEKRYFIIYSIMAVMNFIAILFINKFIDEEEEN
jgi:hypothetical protein